MFEHTGCFNPNAMVQGKAAAAAREPSEDCFPQIVSDVLPSPVVISGTAAETHICFPENVGLSMDNLPCPDRVAAATAMEIAHQQQLSFNVENPYSNDNNFNSHLVEEADNNHDPSQVLSSFDQSNWDVNIPEMQRVYSSHHQRNYHQDQQFPYPTPDLLNLLHLPRSPASNSLVNSSISFANPIQNNTINLQNPLDHVGYHPMGAEGSNVSSVLYDPSVHLNVPAHPPALRELFQSLPQGYTLPTTRNDHIVFGGGDDRDGGGLAYQDGAGRDFDNEVLEFTQVTACVGKKGGGKRNKQFITTEKQRRVDLSSKFDALKDLIPSPTKNDRASVVGDAINYIRELLRTVNELKILVDKKRCGKERIKRHRVDEDAAGGDLESCNLKPLGDQADHSYNECLRSSWLQRKSKDTEVDVRIIDDEVTIKLVQRKKINCLLYASKVLDELELDLQHVAGGHIGDFCSYLFNSKILEGSSVYASAIANKLIEVMDRGFQAA